MADRLHVFIASSSEQIETATKVKHAIEAADQAHGDPQFDVNVWQQGVFDFSAAYIESLEKELDLADFAVVVLTGDDQAMVRDAKANLPRDNVIFELGLFIGRLERKRCFFFIDGDSGTKIASDLSGVKPVEFFADSVAAKINRPSLKKLAQNVLAQMREAGPRYKPVRKVREAQEKLWRFNTRIAGAWWERMRKGEDDKSALSYVIITVDEATNTPRLVGKAFDTSGAYLAEWHSVASAVELTGGMPTVSYRWEGEHDDRIGQQYGGGGRFTFDDLDLHTAKGYFYDTNFALLHSDAKTRIKRYGLYRCPPREANIMKHPYSEEANALTVHKLAKLKGR
jgi:hypothetical protein